jgi:hypothetical protein
MLDIFRLNGLSLDQIIDSTKGSNNDMNAFFGLGHVLADIRASDAGMTHHIHVFSKRRHCRVNVWDKVMGCRNDECLRGLDRCIHLMIEKGDSVIKNTSIDGKTAETHQLKDRN